MMYVSKRPLSIPDILVSIFGYNAYDIFLKYKNTWPVTNTKHSLLYKRNDGYSFHSWDIAQSGPRLHAVVLQRGYTRFWMGMAQRPEANAFQRRALIMQQYPSVCVVGCSDSRVPVEIVFDLGLGDMFVIRVAGNVVGGPVTASVEYAVNHLHVKMVLVMGHEGCGAVKAAMLPEAQIHAESDNLRDFLLDVKAGMGQERLANVSDPRARDREAVITNVVSQLRALKAISSVAEKVRSGDVILSGAFYDLSSGIVDFVNQVKPDEC